MFAADSISRFLRENLISVGLGRSRRALRAPAKAAMNRRTPWAARVCGGILWRAMQGSLERLGASPARETYGVRAIYRRFGRSAERAVGEAMIPSSRIKPTARWRAEALLHRAPSVCLIPKDGMSIGGMAIIP